MEKKIVVFKSFEEQELYNLDEMRKTTVLERFERLFMMQQHSLRMHPTSDNSRKIVILHEHSE